MHGLNYVIQWLCNYTYLTICNNNLCCPPYQQEPWKCEESSCRFPVVPSLEEYHISLLVRNPLGQQSAPYSFNISDRGVNPILRLSSRYSSA